VADQTVRIANMPNAGSHEAVALELWKTLRDMERSADDQLKFFVKCRRATLGHSPSDTT
jgi:hypothetical protein